MRLEPAGKGAQLHGGDEPQPPEDAGGVHAVGEDSPNRIITVAKAVGLEAVLVAGGSDHTVDQPAVEQLIAVRVRSLNDKIDHRSAGLDGAEIALPRQGLLHLHHGGRLEDSTSRKPLSSALRPDDLWR
jgi:hypothetical protein